MARLTSKLQAYPADKGTEVHLLDLNGEPKEAILNIPYRTFCKALDRYDNSRELIQNCFPRLSAEEREFIMTGLTPKEWDEMWKPED